MTKKILIIGASNNPERYAYKAAHMLIAHGHEIVNIGNKQGNVAGVEINRMNEIISNIHTITLYVSAKNQPEYYDYLLKTNPKRIIFNPGTENEELENLAIQQGIEVEIACTLVLLSTGQY